jgi:O-antigen/teichoic acid export membrane protein
MAGTALRSMDKGSHQFEYRRLFARNVIFSAGQWVVQFIAGLFMLGYVVSQLGEEQWGLVVLGMSISTYLALIQAGASVGISKRLNESYTQGDEPTFRSYYTFAILLCVVLSAIVIILTLLIVTYFWLEVGIPERYAQESKLVLIAFTASTVCSALSIPMIGCLQAIHRMDVNSKIQSWAVIVRAVATIGSFELSGPSALAYAVVFLATNILPLLWLYWWGSTNIPEARITTGRLVHAQLIDLFSINGAAFCNTVSFVIFMQAPILLYRENLHFVGLYGIGLQISNMLRGIFFSPFSALTSVMVSLHTRDARSNVRSWFAITTKAYVAAAAMIWLWFHVFGPPALNLWIPSGVNVSTLTESLPYLLGATALGIISLPSSAMEVALGHMYVTASIGIVLALVLILSLVSFVSQEAEDLLTLVSVSVVIFFGLWELSKILRVASQLQYKFLDGIINLLFWPSLPAVIVSLPMMAIQEAYHPDNAVKLTLITAGAGISFLALFFYAGLNGPERDGSRLLVKEFLGRSRKGAA